MLLLKSKIIQIEFADSRIQAVDHIQDISEAIEYAKLNLHLRHHVLLQRPIITSNKKVVVEVMIPEHMKTSFAIGNHLRGISCYLLNKCGDSYRKHLVGKRLLNYIEIKKTDLETDSIPMIDRLETIISFIKLLERSDKESTDAIAKIKDIISHRS